ncbi:hypothetical protein GCM10023324_65920 [Streptomyces youssoufiensis]
MAGVRVLRVAMRITVTVRSDTPRPGGADAGGASRRRDGQDGGRDRRGGGWGTGVRGARTLARRFRSGRDGVRPAGRAGGTGPGRGRAQRKPRKANGPDAYVKVGPRE